MKKVKHDHKGTKALKLTIFFSLMLAPMLAVLFKCCYVTFNKNAYESYYGTTENRIDYEQVTSLSDLVQNKEYIFSGFNVDVTGNNYSQGTTKIICSELTYNGVTYDDGTLSFYGNGNNIYLYYREIDSDSSNINGISAKTATLSFIYNSNSFTQDFSYISQFITEVNYVNYAYLDNAFYYAIDEMKNNQLFNWTTNTVLYTPTAAMTSGMGITTTALPILITYWLYLTAIYIVIDIVIELFTYLTHMITSRIES